MTLHPLFYILYAMLGALIGWSVADARLAYTLVYTGLLALLFTAHIAYVNDLNRSETHDDDIDWDN